MSRESAIQFLKELGTNEKAQKLLQSKEAPKSKDDIIKAYAEVATELGEELSPEDVAIAVEEIETEIRQKTKDASSDIAELEDEDVEDVKATVEFLKRANFMEYISEDEYALTHDVGKKWLNYNKTRTDEGYNSYGILNGSRPNYQAGSVAAGVTGGLLLLAGLATLATGGLAAPAVLGGLGLAK